MSRFRLLLLSVALVVVAAACQVHTEVGIDVAEDGSGTVEVSVTLDREAAGRLGNPATALRLDDLREAGWQLDDAAEVDGGGLRIVGRRDFASADQLGLVLDEIGGPEGIFRGTELTVSDGFSSTTYDFTTTVELSGSLEQFSDAELAAALDGLPLARSAEELAAEGATDPEAATLDVVVDLPGGRPTTNGEPTTDGEQTDGAARWSFSATGGEAVSEQLRSTSTASGAPMWAFVGVAVLAALGAIAALVVGLVIRRR